MRMMPRILLMMTSVRMFSLGQYSNPLVDRRLLRTLLDSLTALNVIVMMSRSA